MHATGVVGNKAGELRIVMTRRQAFEPPYSIHPQPSIESGSITPAISGSPKQG